MMCWPFVRGVFACALVALFLVATPVRGQSPDEDSSVLRSYFAGNGFVNRGMYDLAAEEYRKFLSEHPSHEKAPIARYGLGVSLFRLQQYDDAIDALTQIAGQPGFAFGAEVWMILGQCQVAKQSYPEAVTALDQLLRSYPDHDLVDDALAIQAEAYYRDGQPQQVSMPAAMLVERFPDSPQRERAEMFWGLADMTMGDHASAATRFQAMTERFPGGQYADRTALLLAQSLHRSDQLAAAGDQYQRIIDAGRSPFMPDALYGLSLLMQQQDRPGQAVPLLDRFLQDYPDHTLRDDGRMLRGRVSFDQGQWVQAAEHFDVLANAPGPLQDDAVYWLAKCDLRQEQPRQAADRLALAIEAFPDSELLQEMIFDRAVALLRAEEPEEALEVLAGFRQRFPEDPLASDALHLMAVTEHQQGRYEQSQALCFQFLQEYPAHRLASLILFLTGENEFLPKQHARAAAQYREFLARYPDDPQADKARYRLGMALYQQDDLDEAEAVLLPVLDGAETEEAFRAALLALGDGHFRREHWDRAAPYFQDYVAGGMQQPAADDAMLKMGLSLHRQRLLDEAIQAYDRLIEERPDSAHLQQAVFERGQALVTLDRKDEAVEAFEQVLEIGEDPRFVVHALNHLGAIAMQRGAYVEAAERFGAVTTADTDESLVAEALYQQGQALMAAEDLRRGGRDLRPALQRTPGFDPCSPGRGARGDRVCPPGSTRGGARQDGSGSARPSPRPGEFADHRHDVRAGVVRARARSSRRRGGNVSGAAAPAG